MTVLRLILVLLVVLPGPDARAVSPRLQPVSDDAAPLRSVPSPVVYRPAWSPQAATGTASPSADWQRVIRTSATVRSARGSSATDRPAGPSSAPDRTERPLFLDLSRPNPHSEAEPMGSGRAETNDMFVRLAVWTVIVLGLCVLTVLGLRRWQQRQGILPSGSGTSRILETLALGPGRAVSLVQLGDVQAMVGTDGGGIRTIVLVPPAFEEQLGHYSDDGTDDQTPAI